MTDSMCVKTSPINENVENLANTISQMEEAINRTNAVFNSVLAPEGDAKEEKGDSQIDICKLSGDIRKQRDRVARLTRFLNNICERSQV